jgi:UDP-N-acetylglucosamine 2-epimerase
MLLKFGLRGESNAIIHFGNLLIDNVLTVQQIESILDENQNKTVIQNENYLWLLHIIHGKNNFNERCLWSLLNSIIEKVKQAWKRNSVANLGG